MQPLWLDEANQSIPRSIYSEKMRDPQHYGLRIGDSKVVSVFNSDIQEFYHSVYDLGEDQFETNGYIPETMTEFALPDGVKSRFGPLPEGLQDAYGEMLNALPLVKQLAIKLNQGEESKPITDEERQRLEAMGYL